MSALFHSTMPALVFELMIKSVLLACVVLSTTWFMRRASAAARHLYLAAAALALVILPAAVLLLPSWHPTLLPDQLQSMFARTVVTADRSSPRESGDIGQPVETGLGGVGTDASSRTGRPDSWRGWFFWVWFSGALIFAAGLGGGKLYGFLTARRASVVNDTEFLGVLEEAKKMVGVRREIAVLESRRFVVPSVAGIFRPKLLVPPQAAFWPKERLRAVLQHELSHVKRNDILVQFLAQVVCCLYWLNPFTWVLERKIFIERERACDDMALRQNVKASDYAGFLMEVLEEMGNQRNTLWVTAAMAEGTDFKDRILSVLNPAARRTPPRTGHLLAAAVLTLLVVLPLSSLRPWTTETAVAVTENPARPVPDEQYGGGDEKEAASAGDRNETARTRNRDGCTTITVSALIEQLNSPSATIRTRAAVALGESRDRRAVLPLIEALNDDNPEVREHAATALGQIGDRRAVMPLCDLLVNDRDALAREHAASALGYIGDDRARSALIEAMRNDPDMPVREHALRALSMLAGGP